jgi:hypothetical protein
MFLLVTILCGALPAGSLRASAVNESHLQYVGAVAVNPCQDPKILADWYAKIGIETHESSGGFYGTFMTPAGRGLEPNGVEQDSEGRFAHFKDPDGNEVTLWGK